MAGVVILGVLGMFVRMEVHWSLLGCKLLLRIILFIILCPKGPVSSQDSQPDGHGQQHQQSGGGEGEDGREEETLNQQISSKQREEDDSRAAKDDQLQHGQD